MPRQPRAVGGPPSLHFPTPEQLLHLRRRKSEENFQNLGRKVGQDLPEKISEHENISGGTDSKNILE